MSKRAVTLNSTDKFDQKLSNRRQVVMCIYEATFMKIWQELCFVPRNEDPMCLQIK